MARNRIKLYWLLLLVLMYTATLVLSVGETQARYETTVVHNTLVESQTAGITSNCLVSKNEAPLTVLVGELSMYRSTAVPFWLKSTGADAVGKLAWSVSNPDHVQYLKITMASGVDPIDSNMEIDLLKDAKMEITMNILPTEMARNTEHPAMKINVLVTWGEEMWGTFQVILPEVKNEEENSTSDDEENSEDPEQVPEEDTTTAENKDNADTTEETSLTESTDSDTIVNNQIDAQSGETAQALSENAALAAQEAEGEQETAETAETTEPTVATEETESTEETGGTEEPPAESTDSTEPSQQPTEETTEPTEEPTVSTEPVQEPQPEDPIQMRTLRSFDPTEKLPVKIRLTEEITSVRLGLMAVDQEATEDPEKPVLDFDVLPDYTRFSVNQGESYYMMYDGRIAEFALQGVTDLSVLLDFSHAELKAEDDLILAMEAYAGQTLVETCRTTISPDARESCRTVIHSAVQQMRSTEESAPAAAGETAAVGILSRNNILEYTLPLEWAEKDMEYSVQILTRAEDGSLIYNQVPLTAEGLSAEYTNYNGVHNLVFRIGENLPQAGTYRLNMKWSYEGICYAETQTTFFINYSAYTAYTLGSQEVP